MPSRRYISYKFLYADDLGNESIKIHRSYLNESGGEIVPITQLFTNKLVTFTEKVTGTSLGLRHLSAHVENAQFTIKSPYAPNDNLLIAHLKEILALQSVECGEYRGETLIKNGTHSSIQ